MALVSTSRPGLKPLKPVNALYPKPEALGVYGVSSKGPALRATSSRHFLSKNLMFFYMARCWRSRSRFFSCFPDRLDTMRPLSIAYPRCASSAMRDMFCSTRNMVKRSVSFSLLRAAPIS